MASRLSAVSELEHRLNMEGIQKDQDLRLAHEHVVMQKRAADQAQGEAKLESSKAEEVNYYVHQLHVLRSVERHLTVYSCWRMAAGSVSISAC